MTAEVLKLHLGCFDQATKGWINTDITPHLWVARVPGLPRLLFRIGKITRDRLEQHKRGVFKELTYLDVTKRFPYSDETFDFVFSCHMLEHLFVHEAQACIADIFRVLKSGGICRIVVPDLDKIVADYNPDQPELFLKKIFECDPQSRNAHHWHYNANSLLRVLRDAGFHEAYQCAYRQGRCPDLESLDNRADESCFVEAIK
jgi:predicted SAM-dependent methyltransferase